MAPRHKGGLCFGGLNDLSTGFDADEIGVENLQIDRVAGRVFDPLPLDQYELGLGAGNADPYSLRCQKLHGTVRTLRPSRARERESDTGH